MWIGSNMEIHEQKEMAETLRPREEALRESEAYLSDAFGNQPFDIELYGQLATASAVTSSDSGSSAWQGIPRTCDNTLSHVNLFCYRKGIVDLNAEVSDGTFDHCVAEQKLHGVSREAELDRLMVVLDFQADLNCLQQQAWQRHGQERRLLGGT